MGLQANLRGCSCSAMGLWMSTVESWRGGGPGISPLLLPAQSPQFGFSDVVHARCVVSKVGFASQILVRLSTDGGLQGFGLASSYSAFRRS